MRFAPDGAGGVVCYLDCEEAEIAARDGYVSLAPGEAGALDVARRGGPIIRVPAAHEKTRVDGGVATFSGEFKGAWPWRMEP